MRMPVWNEQWFQMPLCCHYSSAKTLCLYLPHSFQLQVAVCPEWPWCGYQCPGPSYVTQCCPQCLSVCVCWCHVFPLKCGQTHLSFWWTGCFCVVYSNGLWCFCVSFYDFLSVCELLFNNLNMSLYKTDTRKLSAPPFTPTKFLPGTAVWNVDRLHTFFVFVCVYTGGWTK